MRNMDDFQLPSHGQVVDIGGSRMRGDIAQRLRDIFSKAYNNEAVPTLPDELLYDDVGLPIWNDIIFTPEFYQTHDEIAIFKNHGAEVVSHGANGIVLIDLGAGDTRKVEYLLAAYEKAGVRATYLALDISRVSLEINIAYLERQHSGEGSVVSCAGLWGTFEDGLEWVQQIKGPRLFLSLGSVLCNDPWPEALRKVREWAGVLRREDMLLVGMDAHLVPKDNEKIWAAYHTSNNLYKAFFLNGFDHANRLVGDKWFREEDWDLKAELQQPTRHRFYFRAKHTFTLGQTDHVIAEGQEIDWFDSHKYGQGDVETMFEKSGLVAGKVWQAPNSEFCQYLVKPKDDRDQRGDADSAISGLG